MNDRAAVSPTDLDPPPRRRRLTGVATLLRDLVSGLVSALITIAYCISFSALIFQGELQGGLALGLAALLTGSAVTGFIVALTTTLPPVDAGPDTPAVAVMSVLATTVAAKVAGFGGSVDIAIEHVLIAISLSTLLTGLFLLSLGQLRLGQMLRFVPYPVIGGFLAASGFLLISGAIEVVAGQELDYDNLAELLDLEHILKVVFAVGFAALVFLVRQRSESFTILPLAFFAAAVVTNLILAILGPAAPGGWFIEGDSRLTPWWPAAIALSGDIDWSVYLSATAEIGALCGVTAIALLLDVSSLEVARARSANLDREFTVNGIANVVVAALGGAAGNLSLQSSILIEEAGGVTRWAGMFAALAIAAVLLTGTNVASFVPTPLLGGLLIYLGIVMLHQTFVRAPAQRSWTDFLLALAIMVVIIWFGYLVGVVIGLVGACLMFAFSYSRIGVVRRHLTRADFASNVERSLEQAQMLRSEGQRIHVFWLSGFVFFGSSNGLFEEIKRTIDTQKEPPIRAIVLELSGVSGIDTSAILSLVKLRNYCDQHAVELVLSGVAPQVEAALKSSRFLDDSARLKLFASRNDALEWCEDRLLDERSVGVLTRADFEAWIAREFQASDAAERIVAYFDRRELPAGTVLYEQGAAPDTIDLVEAGRLGIRIKDEAGRPLRIRSMSGRTVVGEMGFFRGVPRAASVVAEEDVVLYTLKRANMERMMREEPALGSAFLQFIIRALADRVEFANREIAALI